MSYVLPFFDKEIFESKYIIDDKTLKPLGWWDGDWSYSKEIVIDNAKVDATLVNFPILFNNVSSDFVHAQSDGDDFAFVSYDNTTQYNHEIEWFNVSGDNRLIAWVNITSLSSTVDTVLYLYYGNPSCGSQQHITDTWDSDYLAVYHFGESGFTFYDSTVNNNDITAGNAPTRETGVLGYRQHFDGTSDYLTIPIVFPNNNYTFESFVTLDVVTARGGVLFSNNYSGSINETTGLVISTSSSNRIYCGNAVKPLGLSGISTYCQAGVNQQWVGIRNYYTVDTELYLNGSKKTLSTLAYTGNAINYRTIGARYDSGYSLFWDGTVDEARISKVVRNSSWIKTTDNSCNNSATFLVVGNENSSTPPWSNTIPTIDCVTPSNFSINQGIDTVLSICVNDTDGNSTTVCWWSNYTGSWVLYQVNNSVTANSTVYYNPIWLELGKRYYWNVTADDTHDNVTGSGYTFSTIGFYAKPSSYSQLENWYVALNNTYTGYVEMIKMNEVYGYGKIPNGGTGFDDYYIRLTNESLGYLKPEVLFLGSPHGDEPLGSICLYWFTDWFLRVAQNDTVSTNYSKDYLNWLLDNREIYIEICHNPEGFDDNDREDYNNWDLNREADYNHSGWGTAPDEIFSSIQGKVLRDFMNNHTVRVGTDFHSGSRALLYPWGGTHQNISGTSPVSSTSYDYAPPDFYFFDVSNLRLGDFVGDYISTGYGDLDEDNIGPSTDIFGNVINGSIRDWTYGSNITASPAEDSYVNYSYTGSGVYWNVFEISSGDYNPDETTQGNDTNYKYGDAIRRYVLYMVDMAQPYVNMWANVSNNSYVDIGDIVNFKWIVNGSLVVDNTSIQWGTNPDPKTTFSYNTTCNITNLNSWRNGTGWDNAIDGTVIGTTYYENITLDTPGEYYFVAKSMVDQKYADLLREDVYGSDSYLRILKERTNNSFIDGRNTTDGYEWVNGTLWWYSPVYKIKVNGSIITQIFDYWYLCGNATSRSYIQVLDNWFLCGNGAVRIPTQIFDFWFQCGNATSRIDTGVFDYWFNCGNETSRVDTQILDNWFLCSNTSTRQNTQVFDYYFICGNMSIRSNIQVFDNWFLCGNNTARNPALVFDYWFNCGNGATRISIQVFDYWFNCGNETSRVNTNVFTYWFQCSNQTSRVDTQIFDSWFLCGNTTMHVNDLIFNNWFQCGNESIISIVISNVYPVNSSTGIPLQPTLYLTINHSSGSNMNISWYYGTDLSNTTYLLGTDTSISNSTVSKLNYNASNRATNYYWRIQVNDGTNWVNQSYSFTTEGIINSFSPSNGIALLSVFSILGIIAFIRMRRRKKE